MKIVPVADRVLIRPINEEETTKSGMLLSPVQDRMGNVRGTIVAIGEGTEGSRKPEELKVGSEVIYIQCSATELKVEGHRGIVDVHEDGETLHVLRFNDIVVFLHDNEAEEALDKELDEMING